MKFGIKLWSTDINLIDQSCNLINNKIFNYVELLVVPNTEISSFKIDIPYIIHIPHQNFNVNIGNNKIIEYNTQKVNESIIWADELNAKYLILHPGYGNIENTIDFIKSISDKRILIENMPKIGINNENMIGYSPEQIEKLITNKFGLCLDFGHSIQSSISYKIDYKNYIKRFLKFNPKVFHISDGLIHNEKDDHLKIGTGEYDFKFLKNCITNNKSKYVTLETPRNNKNSLKEDLINLNLLKVIT